MHKTKKFIGGKYLGKGSYGCVITPPLSCGKTKKNTKHNNLKNKMKPSHSVSKIIIDPDEDSMDELKISSLIKKFDPKQQYFITYENYCNLKELTNTRNNTEKVKYSNSSRKYYQSINNKGKLSQDKKTTINTSGHSIKKCLVDLSLKPLNIIMPYGGYDLFDLKNKFNDTYTKYMEHINLNKKKGYKIDKFNLDNEYFHFIKTYEMFKLNFKYCFKNLAKGLYKLHKSRIVNRDIKTENIMANYNKDKKIIEVRFIDVGLAEHLTPQFCSNYYNIHFSGTEQVVPPEIFILDTMTKYEYNTKYVKTNKINYKSYSNNDIMYLKNMKNEFNDIIEKNVHYTLELLKEYEYVDNLYEIKNTEIYKLPIIEKIYNDIKKNYDNKTILNAYFGTKHVNSFDGYLQKADVYGLGCAMYEFITDNIEFINIEKELKLHNLLKKMVHPDPALRYNIIQCLKHPYF